jgi:hypothetical protein
MIKQNYRTYIVNYFGLSLHSISPFDKHIVITDFSYNRSLDSITNADIQEHELHYEKVFSSISTFSLLSNDLLNHKLQFNYLITTVINLAIAFIFIRFIDNIINL